MDSRDINAVFMRIGHKESCVQLLGLLWQITTSQEMLFQILFIRAFGRELGLRLCIAEPVVESSTDLVIIEGVAQMLWQRQQPFYLQQEQRHRQPTGTLRLADKQPMAYESRINALVERG